MISAILRTVAYPRVNGPKQKKKLKLLTQSSNKPDVASFFKDFYDLYIVCVIIGFFDWFHKNLLSLETFSILSLIRGVSKKIGPFVLSETSKETKIFYKKRNIVCLL